ncbi:DUF4959 domain-containing protein [Puteibacter caeruleilacunae]|nr:DUF4959 domain-containing protein [Puteibacter caeruleilacunae]
MVRKDIDMRNIRFNIFKTSVSVIILALMAGVIITSCGEDKEYNPLYDDTIPPQPVTNVEITNLNGKAEVSYELPNERDLSYVLAVCEPSPGVTREVKTSIYSNKVLLEGFYLSQDFQVKLYTVDKAELKSEPVTITVHPEEPEYLTVGGTLEMAPDFGGPMITWENEYESELLLFCFAEDSLGQMKPSESFISTAQEGNYTIRGFDDTERKFGVIVQDKWQNYTDTIFYTITPKKEVELDQSKWKLFTGFKDDTDLFSGEGNFKYLKDGKTNKVWKTTYGANPPYLSYTIDLGVETTFSRVKMWHDEGSAFTGSRFKILELYGSNELESDWSAWTMIHDGPYTVVKPSGLVGKNYTEEDKEAIKNGFEIIATQGIGSFRYLRIKYIENFENRTASASCSELRIYGEVIEE